MVSEVNSSLCYTKQFTPSWLEWLFNNSLGLFGVKRSPSKHKLAFKVGGIVKRTVLQCLLEGSSRVPEFAIHFKGMHCGLIAALIRPMTCFNWICHLSF